MAQGTDRIARVNELLKREIAHVIERYGLNRDGILVSVTKVHASESLRNATVYVSIFGADEARGEEVIKSLVKLKGEIQHQVSRFVILKYTPVLHFVRDNNLEDGDKVLSIIRELEEEDGDGR